MRRKSQLERVAWVGSMVAWLWVSTAAVPGATKAWTAGGSDMNWSTTGNWMDANSGEPASEPLGNERAVIRKAGDQAAVITQSGEVCGTMDIARGSGLVDGLLKILSGDLTIGSGPGDVALDLGGDGNGKIVQSGGTLTVHGYASLGSMMSGLELGGSGAYELSGGTFTTDYLNVGMAGPGSFAQSNGIANVNLTTYIGRWTNGTYAMSGGALNLGAGVSAPGDDGLYVGYGVPGVFTQAGGTIHSNGRIYIGYGAGGSYTMTGGSLSMGGITLIVGRYGGNGTLTMGNETTSGAISVDTDRISSSDMYIGGDASSAATLRGWGDVAMSWIYNNGKVIGDGYGTDRLLDMSHSERVDNYANTATSGWWAVNRGGVVLPPMAFDTVQGQHTHTWGGSLYAFSPSLINSASITLAHDCKGNIRGALLATDRTDLPGLPPSPVQVIGVWDFAISLDPDSYTQDLAGSTIAIRYDDARAAALGIPEAGLVIYQYLNGQWQPLASSVDTRAHIISAGTDSFTTFAVGSLGFELIPGDANRDAAVTFEDFSALQNHYGQSVTGDAWSQGDFSGDDVVSFLDFSLLQNHYGQRSGQGAPAAAAGLPCGVLGSVLPLLMGLGLLSLRRQD